MSQEPTNRIHVYGTPTLMGGLEILGASRKPFPAPRLANRVYTSVLVTDDDVIHLFEELEAGRPLYL